MAGERPADGSSRNSTDGSIIAARAMATIWRSPPESEPAPLAQPVVQPREQLTQRRPAGRRGAHGFKVETHAKVLVDRQAREDVVGLRYVADSHLHELVRGPQVGDVLSPRSRSGVDFTRPNIAFTSVDLPAPFGPTMPTISPGKVDQSQPLRMLTPGR